MNRPRVLLTRRWPDVAERRLSEAFDVTTNPADVPMTGEQLAEALRNFDAICPTSVERIPAIAFDKAISTRIISVFGAGYEGIPLDAARRGGIVVTNTPDAVTACTADLAITLMLMVARRAGEAERLVRRGAWPNFGLTGWLGSRFSGKTLGIFGMGRIGQAVAMRAHHGFGMRIAYAGRSRAPVQIENALGAVWHSSFDKLLPEADFLSFHCPGGEETHHILDRATLRLMKPSAFVINTSRGTVINEEALAEALEQRLIAGAGLDVFEREPAITPSLREREDVVLLPHIGSASVETRDAMGLDVARNLEAFFAGREPPGRVF